MTDRPAGAQTVTRRWRRLVVDGAASLLVVAVLFLVGEAVARRLDLRAGYFLLPTPVNCLRRSFSLGMDFRPHCAARWHESLLTGEQETVFHTNSLGLRDDEVAADGAIRILSLGDSCTWGWQVAQDDAYPRVLQRLLNTRAGSGRYRVINAGRPGYTSYQGLRYLRDSGLALRPAVVLIGFGFNDGLLQGDVESGLAWQRRLYPMVRADDLLLTYSTLWGWLRTVTRNETPRAAPVRVPAEKFKHILTEMVQLTRAHGAQPLLISMTGLPVPQAPYARKVQEVATEQHVPFVVYIGPRIDRIHPTREGYEQLAQEILNRMEEWGYVASAAKVEGAAPSAPEGRGG